MSEIPASLNKTLEEFVFHMEGIHIGPCPTVLVVVVVCVYRVGRGGREGGKSTREYCLAHELCLKEAAAENFKESPK